MRVRTNKLLRASIVYPCCIRTPRPNHHISPLISPGTPMKRSLGRMAMNWLRNPQNQAKVKQTARQLYDRYQNKGGRSTVDKSRTSGSSPAAPTQARRDTRDSDHRNS